MPDDQQERTTAFVSYSWDSEEHQDWVTRLAEAVEREPDIHVTFDQFDLWAGRDLTHFMERAMECERIVVVSTPGYVVKAKERVGGVGYECSLITAELAQSQAQDKFIPVLRNGSAIPAFLQTKLRVDFRDPKNYETALARLLAAIRREPAVIRPAKRNVSLTIGTRRKVTILSRE